jgi:hypothetical protein
MIKHQHLHQASSAQRVPQRHIRGNNEEMVCDERDFCSPAEYIQRKLQSALPGRQVPISSIRLERLVRR